MSENINEQIECCDCNEIHEDLLKIVNDTMPEETELYDLAELFKVFGDSTRIRILFVLFEAEVCVCDLAKVLNMTQSAISHQLRILKANKLVNSRREGKSVFYSLADGHVRTIIAQGREHIEEIIQGGIYVTELEEYYNKFNEEKRLNSRHGRVEFITSMKYIHDCLGSLMNEKQLDLRSQIKILDVGAGTGRYSVPLAEEGYDVTALELVKHNLGRLKQKSDKVKAYQGNATKLKKFGNDEFDLTLVFGPMYHLKSAEEKLAALNEAKRVTKPGGYILVAYIMNEYSVITYAIKEKHIKEGIEGGMLDESFHCTEKANDLYSFVRLEDIEALNAQAALTREKIIAADGAANYIRPFLNDLDEEEFDMFVQYHLSTCERADLMGASAHTVDILRV